MIELLCVCTGGACAAEWVWLCSRCWQSVLLPSTLLSGHYKLWAFFSYLTAFQFTTHCSQCAGMYNVMVTYIMSLPVIEQCSVYCTPFLQGNNLEQVDLQSVGPTLRFLNLSENKLGSVHGLERCYNLLDLDISGNRITRLGWFAYRGTNGCMK